MTIHHIIQYILHTPVMLLALQGVGIYLAFLIFSNLWDHFKMRLVREIKNRVEKKS